MKLTVVIVNYNVKYFLEQCLHSLEKATEKVETEVFVVDNNSVDGSCGMVVHKFPSVHLIANKQNVGFSRANNQAIRKAKGEYILLLNPDTVVEEDTLEKVVQFMDEHPDAGGLGVRMIDGRGNFLPESKRGLPTPWVAFYKIFGLSRLFPHSKRFGKYHLSYLSNNEIHQIDVLAGAFMLMRKETLDKVGLLDEEYFMYGEDIDLSYRITKGGYKNYYFPDTTIIHYKGESTKKGSLNYVKMFYNAMIIFSKKHFTRKNAGLFSFFIHLAIYFRAAIATGHRIVKRFSLSVFDFLLVYSLFYFLIQYWEKAQHEPGYYPDQFFIYVIPAYIIVWLTSLFYSGGYEKPVSIYRIFRGLTWGTLLILVVYSLSPETIRFSRAIILLGAGLTVLAILLLRVVLHFLRIKGFSLSIRKPKRVAIVGLKKECNRVSQLLNETGVSTNIVGFISPKPKTTSESFIGSIDQIREIIRINSIEELIFCSGDISSQHVIQTMLQLSDEDIEYKIAPPESVSIIGSNSIETAGDLYVVNVNAISNESNTRIKRLLDVLLSLSFLLFSPFIMWAIKHKGGFFSNIFSSLFGRKSWVGYHKVNSTAYMSLPVIRKGVLKTTDILDKDHFEPDLIDKLNMLYARDYNVYKDMELIVKSFKKLGD